MQVIVVTESGHIAKIDPQESGIYHIPISLRYTIPKGQLLNDILEGQGLRYVRRQPGVDYELWITDASAEPDSVGSATYSTTPPAGFTGPTF